MWESGTSNLAEEFPLDTGHLIFEILRLLAVCAFGGVGTHALNCVAQAFHISLQSVADNGEIRGQETVVIDENCIFKVFGGITSNKLGHDLRANGHPEMVDAEWLADLLCVVEGCLGIAICDDEDILFWEDF